MFHKITLKTSLPLELRVLLKSVNYHIEYNDKAQIQGVVLNNISEENVAKLEVALQPPKKSKEDKHETIAIKITEGLNGKKNMTIPQPMANELITTIQSLKKPLYDKLSKEQIELLKKCEHHIHTTANSVILKSIPYEAAKSLAFLLHSHSLVQAHIGLNDEKNQKTSDVIIPASLADEVISILESLDKKASKILTY